MTTLEFAIGQRTLIRETIDNKRQSLNTPKASRLPPDADATPEQLRDAIAVLERDLELVDRVIESERAAARRARKCGIGDPA